MVAVIGTSCFAEGGIRSYIYRHTCLKLYFRAVIYTRNTSESKQQRKVFSPCICTAVITECLILVGTVVMRIYIYNIPCGVVEILVLAECCIESTACIIETPVHLEVYGIKSRFHGIVGCVIFISVQKCICTRRLTVCIAVCFVVVFNEFFIGGEVGCPAVCPFAVLCPCIETSGYRRISSVPYIMSLCADFAEHIEFISACLLECRNEYRVKCQS